MKLVFKNSKFSIFDNVLPDELFRRVWTHVQYENYAHMAGNWLKVWRLCDAKPLGSNEYSWLKKPFNNYMDAVGHVFMEIAKSTSEIVGDAANWYDMALRTYIYPRGTKLSWHNDAGHYAGALTYYVHPKWGSTWGGELMVADVPEQSKMPTQPQYGPHLDHEWEDGYLLENGVGQWISPKPNRCVIMAGGTYHSINRVDPDAGDHGRVAIVGFLLKPKNTQAPPDEIPNELEIKTNGSV